MKLSIIYLYLISTFIKEDFLFIDSIYSFYNLIEKMEMVILKTSHKHNINQNKFCQKYSYQYFYNFSIIS